MSVKNRKNTEKKRRILKRLLVVMIILFLLTGLTGIGLVHLQNSRDRAQRKEEAHTPEHSRTWSGSGGVVR